MLQHTPGPWAVVKSPSHNGFAVRSADPNTGVDISVFAAYGGREKERREQALSDVTLVAAAPDLLAALEGVMTFAVHHSGELDATHRHILAARAAISKARGL